MERTWERQGGKVHTGYLSHAAEMIGCVTADSGKDYCSLELNQVEMFRPRDSHFSLRKLTPDEGKKPHSAQSPSWFCQNAGPLWLMKLPRPRETFGTRVLDGILLLIHKSFSSKYRKCELKQETTVLRRLPSHSDCNRSNSGNIGENTIKATGDLKTAYKM